MHPTPSSASPDGLTSILMNDMPIPGPTHGFGTIICNDRITWTEVIDTHDAAVVHPFSELPQGGYYIRQKAMRHSLQVSNSEVHPRHHFAVNWLGVPARTVMGHYPLSSLSSAPHLSDIHNHADKFHKLPNELIIEIFMLVLVEDEQNKPSALLSLARLSRRIASIVRFSAGLWALAFQSVKTHAQFYIVNLLAGNHALSLPSSSHLPRHLKKYIPHAETIDVPYSAVECWIHSLNRRILPRLLELTCPGPFNTPLNLNASALQRLTTSGPTTIKGSSLRSLHLRFGFCANFPDFLSGCPHLTELHIDNMTSGHNGSCWQLMLKPLNNSCLRELRLEDSDRKSAAEAFAYDQIHLPKLDLLVTHSVLWVCSPEVRHVELVIQDFEDLRSMAPHFSNTRYLWITVLNCNTNLSSLLIDDTTRGVLTFTHLRSLCWRSSVDVHFLNFVHNTTFLQVPSLELYLRIPSKKLDDDESNSWDTRKHPEQDRSISDFHIDILKRLRSIIAEGSRHGAKLIIETNTFVGGAPTFVFSIDTGDRSSLAAGTGLCRFRDVRLGVSMATDMRAYGAQKGYPVTPVYVLSALAIEDVEELHTSLHLLLPGELDEDYRGWDEDSTACDVDVKGPGFEEWTLPDALAASHPSDFALLCDNICMLDNMHELKIDIVRSNEWCGVSLLRALINMNTKELALGNDSTAKVTCARLKTIILYAKNEDRRKSVGFVGTLKDEIQELASARGELARQGRCRVPSFSFGPNFCFCGIRASDDAFLRNIRALGVMVIVDHPEEGCMRCA